MILSNPKLNTLEDGLVILWGLMLSYLTTNTASSKNAKRSELYQEIIAGGIIAVEWLGVLHNFMIRIFNNGPGWK